MKHLIASAIAAVLPLAIALPAKANNLLYDAAHFHAIAICYYRTGKQSKIASHETLVAVMDSRGIPRRYYMHPTVMEIAKSMIEQYGCGYLAG